MSAAQLPATGKRVLKALLFSVCVMVALQLARVGVKSVSFLFVARTNFSDRVASFVAMALLSGALVLGARRCKLPLSVFPRRFGALYVAASAAVLALLVLTPILTLDNSFASIVLLIYSAVVTPIFEELIFRGLLWNRLNDAFPKEWMTYIAVTLLFALWHLGYADALALRVGDGLANALFWKAVTGFGFGVVLGALRLKTHNCYATMLLHGVMNIFGR